MAEVVELETVLTCARCNCRNWNVVETRSSAGPFCRCADCGLEGRWSTPSPSRTGQDKD